MLINALCSIALLAVVSAQSSYLGNLKIIEPPAAKSGVIIDTAPSVVYNQSSSKLNGKVVVTPSRGLGRSYNAPAVIPAVRDFRTSPVGENYAAPQYGPVYRPGLAEEALVEYAVISCVTSNWV